MEHYKFSEFDKLTIVEGGLDYKCHFCETDGVFLKYKNISDCKCPWCGKVS